MSRGTPNEPINIIPFTQVKHYYFQQFHDTPLIPDTGE